MALPVVTTRRAGGDAAVEGRRSAVPFVILALPLSVLGLRLIARLGSAFWAAGDLALIELAVGNAARGRQLLGAYSRFGWDQIGPAWFYLAAPFYRIGGWDTRSLFLAAFVLNAAALFGVVAVVRRHGGNRSALFAAVGLSCWIVLMSPRLLLSAWNPHTVVLPVLLVVALSAAAAVGSGWSLAGAVAVASVVVQCHLGTGPVTVASLAVGAAGWVLARRRQGKGLRPHGRPGVKVGLALAGLSLLWTPTVIEQATRTPGNLTSVTRFFEDGFGDEPRRHPLPDAASTVARAASTLPVGRDLDGTPGPASAAREVVAAMWLAATLATAVVARRRGDQFALAAAVVTAAAGVATVVGASRIVGALVPYVVLYAGVLPVGTLIAFGALTRARPRRLRATPEPVSYLAVVTAVVATVALTWAAARTPAEPEPPSPPAEAVVALVLNGLGPGDAPLVVRETDHRHWPLISSVVLGLERAGHDVKVNETLVSLVGESWAPGRKARTEVIVGESQDAVPRPVRRGGPEAQHLGDAAGYRVWLRPGP